VRDFGDTVSTRKPLSFAFGIEPDVEPYRLRQARYKELGEDVARFAQQRHDQTGRQVELLDVGVFNGISRLYIEAHQGSEKVNYHGVDIYPYGQTFVYKHDDWTHYRIDLRGGLSGLESNRFDVVICEQVLEHLDDFRPCLADLARVTAPGGLLIVGVPIFPHGAHYVRKHVIPVTDRLFGVKKVRGHVQAFSKRSFIREICSTCPDVKIQQVRGFRIVSGGFLRPLENYRWWWRLNRRIGQLAASLCVEIQVVMIKT
jgi:2-polyprenyl-3-methyl-5-hydroxy-6-metoxy-1,4-benzoquinol methylase